MRIQLSLTSGVLALLLMLAGSQVQAEWGRNATIAPGWDRLARSAKEALFHPMTWAPAVSGLLANTSGRDDVWTESLYEEAPVFGNATQADESADDYRTATQAFWVISVLITDSGSQPVRNKARGALVQLGAVGATRATSNFIKSITERAEPGKTGDEAEGDAFPSNHATGPFAHAALVRENMKQTRLPQSMANAYTGMTYVAASASTWGRIEAGGHHVSDQLFGVALGNFMATFINDAFMGRDAHFAVASVREGAVLATWTFFY